MDCCKLCVAPVPSCKDRRRINSPSLWQCRAVLFDLTAMPEERRAIRRKSTHLGLFVRDVSASLRGISVSKHCLMVGRNSTHRSAKPYP